MAPNVWQAVIWTNEAVEPYVASFDLNVLNTKMFSNKLQPNRY